MTATDRAALERWHFDSWSPACRALFDGEALGDKLRFTASLIVIDREADPVDARTTLLSVGELYAPDGETLFLALWPRSRGAQLLARSAPRCSASWPTAPSTRRGCVSSRPA